MGFSNILHPPAKPAAVSIVTIHNTVCRIHIDPVPPQAPGRSKQVGFIRVLRVWRRSVGRTCGRRPDCDAYTSPPPWRCQREGCDGAAAAVPCHAISFSPAWTITALSQRTVLRISTGLAQ